MPVELFTDGIEPDDPDAAICRFMSIEKLKDLMETGELYFRRADLFDDEAEGLPPDEYIPMLGLDPADTLGVNHEIGSIAQFREAFFINCWYLLVEETLAMWNRYGPVSVCSRYSLLKAALASCAGRPHLGLVRYGSAHLTGWNTQRFITTKRLHYRDEREVRALLWLPEQSTLTGVNRHFDANNIPHRRPLTPPRAPECQRRKVDLQALIIGIVVSPLAPDSLSSEIQSLIAGSGYCFQVRHSALTPYAHLLP